MKDCPPDKILNPESNRCVSRTGAIGQALLAKESTMKSATTSKSVELAPCSKRGFKQVTGTCWFTSTINTLVLGQQSSKHLLHLYNALSDDDRERITEPTELACPTKPKRDYILGYFHRFYTSQSFDHAESLIPKMFKEKSIQKQGGKFPVQALESMLKECFPANDVLLIKNAEHIKAPSKPCKFCVFYNTADSLMDPTEIPRKLRGDLVLDSCCIYMAYKDIKEEPHVICGFRCGNKDYVYDSNMDEPMQINWTQRSVSLKSMLDKYNIELYKSPLKSVGIMYLLYTKTV